MWIQDPDHHHQSGERELHAFLPCTAFVSFRDPGHVFVAVRQVLPGPGQSDTEAVWLFGL